MLVKWQPDAATCDALELLGPARGGTWIWVKACTRPVQAKTRTISLGAKPLELLLQMVMDVALGHRVWNPIDKYMKLVQDSDAVYVGA